jgi:hypothetical protein
VRQIKFKTLKNDTALHQVNRIKRGYFKYL